LGGPVDVVDPELCDLSVPQPPQIFVCPSTVTDEVPFPNPEMAGQNVTSLELCQVATPAVLCQDGTPLNGTWVHPNSTNTCNIRIPPPVPLFTCTPSPLNNPALVGAQVTDPRLCQAPTTPNICGPGTDLAGVYVNRTTTDCDLVDIDANITTDTEAQCIKCADLAIWFGDDDAEEREEAAAGMIGANTAARNIFDVCNDVDPRPGFLTLLINGGVSSNDRAEYTTPFDRCLDNAAVNPGNSTSLLQIQALSLQENSLTTSVKPEAEIPTFSFSQEMSPPPFSPPSVPGVAGVGDSPGLTALEKAEKLKKQWMDLLP
jgi:hypothetical protein